MQVNKDNKLFPNSIKYLKIVGEIDSYSVQFG